MKKINYVFLCGILFVPCQLTAVAGVLRGNWGYHLDAYFESDDNINRAAYDGYRLEDTAAAIDFVAERDQPLSFNAAFIYSIELEHKSYTDWDKLSHSTAALGLEYRFRGHGGFGAPVYSIYSKAKAVDYASRLRDGAAVLLGFSLTKHLTDRTLFVLGLEAYTHNADSDVFDISRNRLYGLFDWRIGQRTSIYLQYQYLDGDIVSSAPSGTYSFGSTVPYEYDDAIYFTESIVTQTGVDPYGRPINIYAENIIPADAYRLEATTGILELGMNLPVTNDQAFQLSVSSYDSQAQYGFNYSGSLVRLDYLLKF
jgi:hypothetical protein